MYNFRLSNMGRYRISAAADLRMPISNSSGCRTTPIRCFGLTPRYTPTPTPTTSSPASPLQAALFINRQLQRPTIRTAHFLHPAPPKPPVATTPPLTPPPNTGVKTIASFFSRLVRSFSGLATAAAPRADMGAPESAQTKVQRMIDENPVVIFSKSYCRYCKSSKQLLAQHNANVLVLELDKLDDDGATQAALLDLTGQKTVPNIFINREHIGGNSDLQARKHKLHELLLQAGAIPKL